MIIKSLTLFVTLLLASSLFSQIKQSQKPPQNLFSPGFDHSRLTMFGFSSAVLTDLNSLSLSNPALLGKFSPNQTGISFGYTTDNSDYYQNNIKLVSNRPYIPNNVIFITSCFAMNWGISYSELYGTNMDPGEFIISTVEQPDGTGETFHPVLAYRINQYAIAGSRIHRNLFFDHDQLTLGFSVSLNHLSYYEEVYRISTSFNGFKPGVLLGFTYSSFGKYLLGAYYKNSLTFEGTADVEGPELRRASNDSNPRGGQYYLIADVSVRQFTPSLFSVGLLGSPMDHLQIYFQMTTLFWEDTFDKNTNSMDFSSGAVFNFTDFYSVSFGFNSISERHRYTSGFDGNLNSVYLFIGNEYSFDQFKFSAIIADNTNDISTLPKNSGDRRKQTIFKLGCTYGF